LSILARLCQYFHSVALFVAVVVVVVVVVAAAAVDIMEDIKL